VQNPSTNYLLSFNNDPAGSGGLCFAGCSVIPGMHFGCFAPWAVSLRFSFNGCTQIVSCAAVSNAYAMSITCGSPGMALINVDIPCGNPPPSTCCPPPNAFFGLGAAAGFSVLGLTGADVTISEGATLISGNVGLGPNDTGDLLKATIKGTLFLDPTSNPDIHPDLVVTGGTVSSNLTGASAAAISASANLAGLAPTQTFGDITASKTFTGNGGVNVIALKSVNLVKGVITISGTAADVFVFNVKNGFNFSSSQMKLVGGVTYNNILWNFSTTGSGDIKDVTVADGIFLAPNRNVTIDHTITIGAVLAGGQISIHSGATEGCPCDSGGPPN
jgi:hypothetical protein